jgi:hypothetical protein
MFTCRGESTYGYGHSPVPKRRCIESELNLVGAAAVADEDEDSVDNDNTNNSEVAEDASGAVDVSEDMDNDIDADEGDDTWTCEVSKWQDGLAMLAEYPRKVIVLRFPWTPARFQRVFGNQRHRGHARLIDGRVHIFELPSNPHEAITSRIISQVVRRNDYVFVEGSADIVLGNSVLQPDQSLYIERPLNPLQPYGERRPPGDVGSNNVLLPKVVIEVAAWEPLQSIGGLPALYLHLDRPDGIRGVLSVINRRSRDADIQKDQLVAVWYQYGNWDAQTGSPVPSFAISFGNRLHWRTKRAIERRCAVTGDMWRGVGVGGPPCDRAGIPEYQFPIPVASVLWHGCTDPEMVAMRVANTAALSFDLFEVKFVAFRRG